MENKIENINNDYFIKIGNSWFITKDENGEYQESLLEKYDSLSFNTYCIMLRTLTMRNTFNFNLKWIYDTLKIDYTKNTTQAKKIKDAILKMNKDLFTIYENSLCTIVHNEDLKLNDTYFCKCNQTLESKFFTMFDCEVDEIIDLEINNKLEKGTLLTQFAFICKSFGGQEKDKDGKEIDTFGICYPSLDTIAKNTLICEKTILKNNNLLVDSELLLIGNAGMNIVDGDIKNVSNLYARPQFKEQFNKYLEKMKSAVSIKNNNTDKKAKQNEMRRLSQLMNNFRKNNKILEFEDLSDTEFEELNKLELEYFTLAKNEDGKVKKKSEGHRFLTITLDGKIKNRLTDAEWEKREYQEQEEIYKKHCVENSIEYVEDEDQDILDWGTEEPVFKEDKVVHIKVKQELNEVYGF